LRVPSAIPNFTRKHFQHQMISAGAPTLTTGC
jgi:hypothetical protein